MKARPVLAPDRKLVGVFVIGGFFLHFFARGFEILARAFDRVAGRKGGDGSGEEAGGQETLDVVVHEFALECWWCVRGVALVVSRRSPRARRGPRLTR